MRLPREIEGLKVLGRCKKKEDIEYYGDWSKAISYLLLTDGQNYFICYNEGYSMEIVQLDDVIFD